MLEKLYHIHIRWERVVCLVSICCVCASLATEENFCSKNILEERRAGLQFTKEVTSHEHPPITRYKELHCCVKNYVDIEWFKDDAPLFPPGGERSVQSTFSRLLERNQSLVSTSVRNYDAGNYTCVARSGEQILRMTITVRPILANEYAGPPRVTFHPQAQYAEIGESARLFCEAFIGFGGKQNKTSEIYWMKDGLEMRFAPGNMSIVPREDGQIIGAYLSFDKVNGEEFGNYTCCVSNGVGTPLELRAPLIQGVDPSAKVLTSYKAAVVIVAVSVCLLLVSIMSYVKWHLELQLFWKDRFGTLEDNDEKQYDVFVCYDQSDAEFALGVLVPTLEETYRYRCFAYERDSIAGNWIPETYCMTVQASRRFLMVLSPALALNSWCTYALYVAIEAMLNLHSKIICIVLQDIPWDSISPEVEGSPNCTLRQVLRIVKKVRWDPGVVPGETHHSCDIGSEPGVECGARKRLSISLEVSTGSDSEENMLSPVEWGKPDLDGYGGSVKFWTALRLHLPPKRPPHVTT